MDPVLQVLQQARSGSAEGEGFGRDYFQGKQLNLMQQRLNMEKREQDALLPLKQKLLRYDALQRGLEMGTALTEEDVTLQMNAFLPKVNDLLLRFMRSPKGFSDDSLINEYQTLYSQNPWAFSAGNGARIKQGMDAQLMQRNNWIQVLEHDEELKKRGLYLRGVNPKTGDMDIGLRQELGDVGTLKTEIDPTTGRPITIMQTGPRTARPLLDTEGAIRNRQTAMALHKQAEDARELSIPNPDAPGLRMIDPNRFEEFSARSRFTPGDVSTIEQRIVKREETARRFVPLIERAETIFGPKAITGTVIVDRVLANVNPKWVEGQRVQGREAARFVLENIFQSLSEGQGRLSDQDVERYRALAPELGNIKELIAENPERARQVLQRLQKEIARDAISDMRMLGRQPSESVLIMADPEYLIEEVKNGRLSTEVFRRAFNNNVHKADVQRLSK